MTSPSGKAPITVRLELSIPTDLGAGVQVSQVKQSPPAPRMLVATCTYPGAGDTTTARAPGINFNYVICAKGNTGGAEHIAARVYAGNFDTSTLGNNPDPHDSLLRIVFTGTVDQWQIDELPVEDLQDPKQLVLWSEQEGNYQKEPPITFHIMAGSSTYCQTYASFTKPAAQRPSTSRTPDRWLLKIAGCSNRGCDNCTCLNGEWLLARDGTSGAGLRWYRTLDQSFSGPDKPCYWRLVFNPSDGFYCLDCVEKLEQAPGTWIAYRLHETAWNPSGPNTLHLVTDSGYCNVPATVTLAPA